MFALVCGRCGDWRRLLFRVVTAFVIATVSRLFSLRIGMVSTYTAGERIIRRLHIDLCALNEAEKKFSMPLMGMRM